MSNGAPHPSTFELRAGSLAARDLTVLAFRGRESISRGYRVDIDVAAPFADPAAFEPQILEQPMHLALQGEGAPLRVFHGVCTHVAWSAALDDGRSAYRLRLASRLSLLGRRRASRIFQDRTVDAIVDLVLEEWRIPRRFARVRAAPKRAYCVQYRETDRDFVTRLLAEEGLFYYFEHDPSADAERMVIGDDASIYPPITGAPRLFHRSAPAGTGALTPGEDHVQRFVAARSVRPTASVVRDYDFERPLFHPSSSARTAQLDGGAEDGRYEHYEHHGDYEKVEVAREDATIRLEQLRRKAVVARGETACRRLVPGRRFFLEEHDVAAYDRGWVVTRVDHEGEAPQISGASPTYRARFACAPDTVCVRPRPAPRRIQQVVETATVVGPPGEEVHTDAFGRIKVQFHWDREGQGDDRSSCWIRHAELWAGRGFGTQFVPRVGMEVVVSFLGGDVDRPIVTGCVANAVNRAPFQLPDARTRSGVKTRSSPNGGGHNELSFEDRKGSELVHLRAERELDVRVGTDQRVGVGGDRSVAVAGRDALDTGDRLTKVRRDDDLEVEGRRSVRVFGESEEHVLGDRALRVDGIDKTNLLGGSVLTVEGPSILRVTGEYSIDVGTGDDAGAAQINVSGSLVLGGSKSLRLITQGSLTLSAGESSLEISPEGIRIMAGRVEIAGAQALSLAGKGPTLSLGEEAELAAKKIRMFSTDAALELDEDAALWGKLVKLNCSRDEPPPGGDEDEEKTKPFNVQLTDEELEPYGGKRYQLVAEGRRFEGETDVDGAIAVEIPETAQLVEITMWPGKYPTGPRKKWTVRVAALPEATTVEGALRRLKNLGYYEGAIKEDPPADKGFRAALAWFQKDHELGESGELDAQTAGELVRVHGS
ncbi:Putative Rhs element Vgr protein [Sorangium cellulosum So ce56]|uniref:Rhs element Vgr protein n=1 Tax=Sorangium cellulosum (strain So ce56) TaxID=448385 RepID=A9FMV8_SORC5|nr:type VI secretion system tip protein TssI/VgrG [Sorangium cellulosum]CAN98366.1 Putative Rhs element Vgr protein [Sorangium cellulosum So ce56]